MHRTSHSSLKELFYLNGTPYDQLAILDESKLAEVGLPWSAPTILLYSIGANLAIGATITHVLLWYGKEIMEVIHKYRAGENFDPHLAKMKVYKEVPMWWYLVVLLISFAMAMATIYTGHARLPW